MLEKFTNDESKLNFMKNDYSLLLDEIDQSLNNFYNTITELNNIWKDDTLWIMIQKKESINKVNNYLIKSYKCVLICNDEIESIRNTVNKPLPQRSLIKVFKLPVTISWFKNKAMNKLKLMDIYWLELNNRDFIIKQNFKVIDDLILSDTLRSDLYYDKNISKKYNIRNGYKDRFWDFRPYRPESVLWVWWANKIILSVFNQYKWLKSNELLTLLIISLSRWDIKWGDEQNMELISAILPINLSVYLAQYIKQLWSQKNNSFLSKTDIINNIDCYMNYELWNHLEYKKIITWLLSDMDLLIIQQINKIKNNKNSKEIDYLSKEIIVKLLNQFINKKFMDSKNELIKNNIISL